MPRARKKKPGKTESFGDRLRKFRLERGLTQAELGKLIGVSQRVITYYEVRGVSPTPNFVIKTADALGVSLDELFGRRTSPRKPPPVPAGESLRRARVSAVPAGESLRRVRRLKRLEELSRDDQVAVLRMIEAMADRSKRKASRGG